MPQYNSSQPFISRDNTKALYFYFDSFLDSVQTFLPVCYEMTRAHILRAPHLFEVVK